MIRRLSTGIDGRTTEVTLDDDGCYLGRNAMHRYMAPPDSCNKCAGRGWYETGHGERYCACPAGARRRATDR